MDSADKNVSMPTWAVRPVTPEEICTDRAEGLNQLPEVRQ